jgi:hypothetical protein
MDTLSMEKAMLENMLEKTGKKIEDWLVIINSNNFLKHGEIVKYLKLEYSIFLPVFSNIFSSIAFSIDNVSISKSTHHPTNKKNHECGA